mgnify:CR=1 FL=1
MKALILSIFLIMSLTTNSDAATKSTAIFAGGCFWCMQPVFDSAEGVTSTFVGYSGGDFKNPTYEDLHNKNTGHYEAIEVTYNPTKASYEELVRIYFANIDPFDEKGQFADKGQEYETVIFYADAKQKEIAEKIKAEVAAKFPTKKIAVKILPAKPFYKAEDYHQKYYQKNQIRYELYKHGSGRADGIKQIWGSKK